MRPVVEEIEARARPSRPPRLGFRARLSEPATKPMNQPLHSFPFRYSSDSFTGNVGLPPFPASFKSHPFPLMHLTVLSEGGALIPGACKSSRAHPSEARQRLDVPASEAARFQLSPPLASCAPGVVLTRRFPASWQPA
jgi:hypothetical protein